MVNQNRIIKLSFSLLFLLPLLITAGCDPFSFKTPHPSDRDLTSNFQKHEAEFNEIVRMSNEDSKMRRIAHDFTRPENESGFSAKRWDQYRSLFNRLGLTTGLSREADSTETVIYLTAFSKGMVNRGSSKGYAYSEKPLLPLFDSLDEASIQRERREKHGVFYKKIKENWYLSYDW